MSFPNIILIDNSSYCNLRCSMCDHRNIEKYRKRQHMSMSLYKSIIDEIAKKKPEARVWDIFFGDPFCCPDMVDRIKYAKNMGLTDVVLNTNGLAMNKKKAEAFIRAGLDSMYVGVDAFLPKTYEKIRVGGDLEKVKNNILNYRDLLIQFGGRTQKLFVQFVECADNINEVEDFIAFWKSAGVSVKIRPRVSWGGIIQADNLDKDLKRVPCNWAMNSISICADGRYAYCAIDLHCQESLGSYQEQNIEQIWSGKMKEHRQLHIEHKFEALPLFCKNCLDWQSARCEYK